MTAALCQVCRAPTGDETSLCTSCTDTLQADLADLAAYAVELEIALAKQSRIEASTTSRPEAPELLDPRDQPWLGVAVQALAYDDRASDALHRLTNTVTTWARILDLGDLPAHPTPERLARWLLARTERIRSHEAGGQIANDMHREARQAAAAVDRPAERMYAGPCDVEDADGIPCPGELYAEDGQPSIVCRECGITHDVLERRGVLLKAAEDVLARASMIAIAVTSLGEPVTPQRIYNWRDRGRLMPKGRDVAKDGETEGEYVYRVGDVLDLLAEARNARARGRRSA